MDEQNTIDDILHQAEGKTLSQEIEDEQVIRESKPDDAAYEQAEQRRDEKVRSFELNLDFLEGDDKGVPIPPKPQPQTPAAPAPAPEAKKKNPKRRGCLGKLIYTLAIIAVSGLIAYFAIIFICDVVGLNQSGAETDVEIPAGASTEKIADILKANNIIQHPMCFRLYSKITKADGKYQLGTFVLSAEMGYTDIVEILQTSTPRDTVTVTIPEGYTVNQIAKLLADNNVCKKEEFYEAVINADFNYDFVRAIPSMKNSGRVFRLEGYLFPDTYNFYVNGSGESAVDRMLKNLNNKLDDQLRAYIEKSGFSIDEVITLASIVQGEAAKKDDMDKVGKVLRNRLMPNSGFDKLQCDSTGKYIRSVLPVVSTVEIKTEAYDTYQCTGLPAGAIGNPGLDAITAVVRPSEDPDVADCYYFASDYNTGITYFTKTYAQHVAICRKYRIGMYG